MLQVKTILLIAIMACCSFTTNSVYYGIGFEIEKFGMTITQSMLLFGFAEIINYSVAIAIMAKLPSIPAMLCACSLLPTLACLSFFTDSVLHSQLLQMAATVIVRFLITTYGSIYITYYVEHLPKKVEGTSAGIIEGLGGLGKVVAPYAVRIGEDIKINPMGLFGFIYFIIGFLPLLFLPKPAKEEATAENSPRDLAVK
jgi:sugar phosphate permease